MNVHRRFRTLILQNENGLHRLSNEAKTIPEDCEDWIRISEPPESGMDFQDAGFAVTWPDK